MFLLPQFHYLNGFCLSFASQLKVPQGVRLLVRSFVHSFIHSLLPSSVPGPGPDVGDTMMSQDKYVPYGAHSLVGADNQVGRHRVPL